MKKQLNIPGSKTKTSSAANTASGSQRAGQTAAMSRLSSSPSVSRPASASKPSPASSNSRPSSISSGAPRPGGQGSGMVKVTPGSTSAKAAAAQQTKKPDQGSAKPPAKPSDVICIDMVYPNIPQPQNPSLILTSMILSSAYDFAAKTLELAN